MSRFARVTEEILTRHLELAEKLDENGNLVPGKGALQTLYLYQLILLRSWATGISDMTLPQICETYGLDLDNSYRRLKILKQKNWVADTKKYIKPLIVHRADASKTVKNTDEKGTVNSTVETERKTVKITVPNDEKAVKITANNCKNYSESDEKAVKITVKNPATHDEISDSGDAKIFKDLKSVYDSAAKEQKPAAAAVETNGSKSIFSLEECLRYAVICDNRGEPIKSVEALAKHAFKTGEMDAFISATLYSEPMPEQTVEYDELETLNGNLTDKQFNDALRLLIETQADGFDTSEWEKFYTAEDWTRLNEAANNYK